MWNCEFNVGDVEVAMCGLFVVKYLPYKWVCSFNMLNKN
jgi:hypothetical protein